MPPPLMAKLGALAAGLPLSAGIHLHTLNSSCDCMYLWARSLVQWGWARNDRPATHGGAGSRGARGGGRHAGARRGLGGAAERGANLHLLGQPKTLLAQVEARPLLTTVDIL